MYYNRSDLGANVKHLDDNMRGFILTEGCRRKYLMEYFGFDCPRVSTDSCCDNCLKPLEPTNEETVLAETTTLLIRDNEMKQASVMLSKYFSAENSIVQGVLLPQLSTGLTDSLLECISGNMNYCDPLNIKADFPYLRESFVQNIAKIMCVLKEVKQTRRPVVL